MVNNYVLYHLKYQKFQLIQWQYNEKHQANHILIVLSLLFNLQKLDAVENLALSVFFLKKIVWEKAENYLPRVI